MQSINAGFQNLRTLIPHHEGEKLSKVPKYIIYIVILSLARITEYSHLMGFETDFLLSIFVRRVRSIV